MSSQPEGTICDASRKPNALLSTENHGLRFPQDRTRSKAEEDAADDVTFCTGTCSDSEESDATSG